MKRIINCLICAASVLLLHACDLKEDRAFRETPDERLGKVLAEYSEALVSAPNGWLLTIDTKKAGGFQLYMSFNDRERVVMLCDIDATYSVGTATSTVPCESSYQLKALQMPSLIFDTYNYLHLMADPQDWGHGGGNGQGLGSDFEFDILNFDSGVFSLRGCYNKCRATLRQATPEEAEAVLNGSLKTVYDRIEAYNESAAYPVVEIDGMKAAVTLTGRSATFRWTDVEGAQQEVAAGTCMELTGAEGEAPAIRLLTTAEVLGKSIARLMWNGEGYNAVDAAGNIYTGYDNEEPIIPLVLGDDELYSTMTFTTPAEFAGTVSQAYLETYYNPARELYTAWGKKITKIKCLFTTNADNRKVFRVYAYSQTPPATTEYQAGWDIDYVVNEDGTYTFSNREAGGNSGNITNARNYGQKMRGMLDIFSKVTYSSYVYTNSTTFDIVVGSVEPHTFRLEWMKSATPGLEGQLGAFVDVDNPQMYFCGVLSK